MLSLDAAGQFNENLLLLLLAGLAEHELNLVINIEL